MKRIDKIEHLASKCTGCAACIDACPTHCISSVTGQDGFFYTEIDASRCVECGKCYASCPIVTLPKHKEDQHLYAAYSTIPGGQNRGSSGGMFELLAQHCLAQGFYVCGAAFEGTTLKHRIIKDAKNLAPLLKSKYLQSNTEGIYVQIINLLKNGEKVFFCGTPCQVSALINLTPPALKEHLLTADIICHGVPSQNTFDAYIRSPEKKARRKNQKFFIPRQEQSL